MVDFSFYKYKINKYSDGESQMNRNDVIQTQTAAMAFFLCFCGGKKAHLNSPSPMRRWDKG